MDIRKTTFFYNGQLSCEKIKQKRGMRFGWLLFFNNKCAGNYRKMLQQTYALCANQSSIFNFTDFI